MQSRCTAVVWVLFLSLISATADNTISRLYSFGAADSAASAPFSRLIQASDGFIYGTTSTGGQFDSGILFRLGTNGSGFTRLKTFSTATNDGQHPFGALIEASDGALYGTTEIGGEFGLGTIFRINKDGTSFNVLKSFTGTDDGAYPDAGLLEATNGLLYGTTSGGGTNDNGVVFSMAKDGSVFSPLVRFNGTNGANPECELIQASDGLLYGTTSSSATTTNLGTIFRLQTDGGGFVVLDRFILTSSIKTNGAAPQARLVEGTNGMLYGTTSAGGTKGMGTIYRLNKDGSGFQMLYHFGTNTTPDGRYPLGDLTLAGDGVLYGTTYDSGTNGNGTVFRIALDGSSYAQLASLTIAQGPAAGLIEASNGLLYGTTQMGGTSGDGTVFSLQKDGSNFTILKNFSATGEDGRSPYSSPILAGTNELFGTTRGGGRIAAGTIYKMRFDGASYQQLSSLDLASGPSGVAASLLELTNGALLGLSQFGGGANNGTLFSFDPTATNLSVAYSPPNTATGREFRAAVIQASDGLIYGTAVTGGASGGGAVFRANPDGSDYTVLKSFATGLTAAGSNPVEPLLEGSDGVLYGTTCFGGTTNRGVVFSLTKDGNTYNVLKTFGTPAGDGEGPMSPLIEATDGMVYGTTYGGGSTNNGGTVFRIKKDGTAFQVILAFVAAGEDGRHPCGNLAEWSDGAIYGTTERGGTNDQGTIFRVAKDGSSHDILVEFGGVLGAYPRGGLVKGPDGALYGSTDQGGDMRFGTVFRFGPAFGDITGLEFSGQFPAVNGIGRPGAAYLLEYTTALGPSASWSPVFSTNAPSNGQFSVVDQIPLSGAGHRFYRFKY